MRVKMIFMPQNIILQFFKTTKINNLQFQFFWNIFETSDTYRAVGEYVDG